MFQSVLLLVVLLRKYDKQHSPLLSLLCLISVGLALRLGYSPDLYGKWIKWLLLSDVTILLFGPLFYDFIRSLVKDKTGFRDKRQWLHFFIAGLFLVHFLVRILPYSSAELLIKEQQGVFYFFYTIFFVVGILSNFGYLIFSFRSWYAVKAKNVSFTFVKAVLVFNGLILLSWMITFVVSIVSADEYVVVSYGYQIAFVLLAIGVIAISYRALLGSSILQVQVETVKYAKPSLTEEELIKCSADLMMLMSEDKPYLQSSLSLEGLGKSIDLNKTQLSEAINRQFGKSFPDWVNEYRVQEFIDRIESGKFGHLTFMGIASEVGFNTKATFNRAFKKHKGKSPSQYFAGPIDHKSKEEV